MNIIRGSGGGKGGGGSARVANEATDNLQSKQLARVVDLISEGEINGLVNGLRSVYLDNTPIQNDDGSFNVKGVGFSTRNGTQAQTHIPGFPSVESEEVVSVEVTQATSLTRTVTDTSADSVRVTLSVPRLTSQNTSNGDVSGTTVRIAIDVQESGGSFVAQKLTQPTISLSNSSSTQVSSVSTDILNAQLTVNWQGSEFNFSSINWRVDYRAVGAGSWIALSAGSFSGSGFFTLGDPQGDAGQRPNIPNFPTGAKSVAFVSPSTDAYEFRIVKVSGSGSLSLTGSATAFAEYDDITGKTSSRYQRAYEIPLTGTGPWDIRVRRLTADSSTQALQNKTFWDSFTKIIDEKFSYPNSALHALSIDSELFSKIPTRGYEIEGMILQVPSNYNALERTYSGVWDGTFTTAYSNNPAWVFYDLVVNSRYGLGNYVSAAQLDKFTLFEIAQYCDELVDNGQGGTEPRYTINVYLQTREEAIKMLQSLASAFAAMSYWAAGSVTLTQDAPKQPSALFTPANVVNGAFSYSGSSVRTRSTVIAVTWNDPLDLYRQAVEYIEDLEGVERFGYIKKDVVAFGCTSRGQAHRFGKAILFTESMETDTVTFSTGLDGLAISPGEVIQTSDPVRSGDRLGGRLQAATASAFTLDASVTIDGTSVYTLFAVMPDGTVESSTVSTGASTTTTLAVSPAFSASPELQSIWVLASTTLNPETWRVISINEDGVNASITALEYRSDKYAAIENNISLNPIIVSNLRVIPNQPSAIEIEEELYLITGTLVGVRMLVSWQGDRGARYELEYRPINGNWIKLNSATAAIDVEPVVAGTYQIRITAISSIGLRSQVAETSKIIYGLTEIPVDVENFQLQAVSDSAFLTWDESTDLDVIVGGKIKIKHTTNTVSPSWSSSTEISGTIAGSTISATLPLIAGVYLAKWIDSTGNQSLNATAITTNAPSVLSLNAIAQLTEPGFTGTKTDTAVSDTGGLILDSYNTFDEQPGLIDTWPTLSFLGGISATGNYIFNDAVDLGSVQTSRITTALAVTAFDASDLIDSRPLIDTWSSIDGGLIDDVDATLYVRTSTDNVTFGDYQVLIVGDYLARSFQFKLELQSNYETHNISVDSLSVSVDMPDRTSSGEDIVSGAASKSISYPFSYQVIPAIGITAQNMATGDFYEITNKAVTGFDIIFKNSSGTAISRTFDHITRGY
jgi:predicted phage tail protein